MGLVAKDKAENYGAPYCLTDQFVAVRRLHPALVGIKGKDIVCCSEDMPKEAWRVLVRFPCGKLELHNCPSALRDVAHTDGFGHGLDERVDLPASDLYGEREGKLKGCNDFKTRVAFRGIWELRRALRSGR